MLALFSASLSRGYLPRICSFFTTLPVSALRLSPITKNSSSPRSVGSREVLLEPALATAATLEPVPVPVPESEAELERKLELEPEFKLKLELELELETESALPPEVKLAPGPKSESWS